MDTRNLNPAAIDYRMTREMIKRAFPEADEQTLADTTEGLTTIHEQVGFVIGSAKEDDMLAEALHKRIEELEGRWERISRRSQNKRRAVQSALELANLKKLELPEFTVSLRNVPPAVIILDEDKVPEEYRIPSWRLNRQSIKEALKEGVDVPGATMSNGGITIAIRT